MLVVVAGLTLLAGLPWLVVEGPYYLDDNVDDLLGRNGTESGGAALVTGLRTALVACVATVGAGIALVYTVRNYRLTRRGQVTDRFTKALERLGSEEIYVRIGGVLALEQIVQDAPEQATHAAQVLGHFVRERAPDAVPSAYRREVLRPSRPASDVQDALRALTRPASRTHLDARDTLDLPGLHLAGADLFGADLTNADLYKADLTDADLRGADLTKADLRGADLTNALLLYADLTSARLREADLTNVLLLHADLAKADLRGADLTKAGLRGADLTSADLRGADLTKADLRRADLREADLTTARGLTAEQLQVARLDGAQLPAGLVAEPGTASS
ncbi:pentapeptide repeat-containing protein [Streptomyces sp. YC504]|uniref:Pentapeptide repeat-containing protein n=1 Tax=Streptomyces mesophilus TaxID=1775132 RepID=A0A6G4XWE6_9ACTN|nr:pentapeptide repeat-containing protein [Streptomyces mesophilus]NGO81090.1 pentapeptide repeat-containing protein [Streptomyces mesophilus]